MTASLRDEAEGALDDAVAAILLRWRQHTGAIREWRSLYYKGTVLAVTAEHRLLRYLHGYERENTLTPREHAAFWPGMLATQLFFIQWFAQARNEEHLDRNLRALTWIHRHRDAIQRTLSGTQDDRSAPTDTPGNVP